MGNLNLINLKKLIFLFLFPIFLHAQKSNKVSVKKQTILFYITQTNDWCGGMRPSDDMVKDLNSPKSLSNKWIFIKKKLIGKLLIDLPVIDSFESNENGEIKCSLSYGNYQVVEAWNKDRNVYESTLEKYRFPSDITDTIDKKCFDKVFNQPYYQFKVSKLSKSKQIHKLNFHKTCNYSGSICVRYKGPYPN
jgi:hypothetical protein